MDLHGSFEFPGRKIDTDGIEEVLERHSFIKAYKGRRTALENVVLSRIRAGAPARKPGNPPLTLSCSQN